MRPHLARDAAQIAAVAAVYYGAAKLGLSLAFAAEQVSAVWPPTGISLAALVLLGYRVWPGIILGAFLANITAHEPIGTAFGIAVGNTLEALLGAWLLQRWAFRPSLRRLRDVLALLLLAAALSTIVSASIGATCLCLGVYPWTSFASLWWVWWLGDAVGDVVVAPVLLTWAALLRSGRGLPRAGETVALLAGLAAVSLGIFTVGPTGTIATQPLAYTIFPFIIWAALRLGPPATTLASVLASAIAIGGTVRDLGPFGEGTPHERLIALMIFLGVVTISALVVGAATEERNAAERHHVAGFAVAQALAEALTLGDAVSGVLQSVCKSLGWDVGAFWDLDRQANVMRCVELWRNPSRPGGAFEALTRATSFTPGVGLPGRVWQGRRPYWVRDVTMDPNFPRGRAAAQDGLHAAFGFPVVLGNKVVGVVEFFSREIRSPDDELLRQMAAVGSQLGLFIERKRAEEALRESEERLRLALNAGKIGAWDWDIAKDRVTWSERIFEFHGMPPGTFGGTIADFARLIHPDDAARVRRFGMQSISECRMRLSFASFAPAAKCGGLPPMAASFTIRSAVQCACWARPWTRRHAKKRSRRCARRTGARTSSWP